MSQPTPLNSIGRISHFFATNQSLSILLLLTIVIFGLVSFFITPKQYNPEITRPAFLVSLEYSGATLDQSLNRVVYELVEKVNTVPGVDDIYTEVTDGGEVETTVIFEVGYDPNTAKLDLRSQLLQHEYLAQGFISPPTIIEINPETIPVLQIAFAGTQGTPADLREDVARLSQQLGDVPDVSALSVHGGYIENVVVELQPERLQTAGVTIEQMMRALGDAQGRSVHSGINTENYKIEILFDDTYSTVSELGALPITKDVQVRDVARVYQGVSGERSSVWYGSHEHRGETVVLGVAKVEGSSAPVVTDDFLQALDSKLQKKEFEHLSYEVVANDGATASREIYGLSQNLITSIAIVALILMLFLSLRAAAVVLVAIPTTLLIVFGLGFIFGETINRITLFALILSLGLLVDSAIVVVENIYAHLEDWRRSETKVGKETVIARAVSEVGVGLVLSTVTSVIVFLPMAYITGMMGPYMGPIAFFVPAALVVSLFVAIVVVPFVANRIIGGREVSVPGSVFFMKMFNSLTLRYTKLLRKILQARRIQRLVLRSALLLFIVSLVLPAAAFVHFQMLPKADRDQVYVYLDLPVDASLTYTLGVTKGIEDVLIKNPNIVDMQSYVGEPPIVDFNGMFKGAQGRDGDHQSTIRVNFKPTTERSESSSDLAIALRDAIVDQSQELAQYIRIIEEPPGPPVRATFVAKISAEDQSVQEHVASKLYTAIDSVTGITDRYIGIDATVARTQYSFDHEAARELGVSMGEVDRVLSVIAEPLTVSEYRASDSVEQTAIVLSLPATNRDAPTDVSALMVGTAAGEVVPLAAVLTTETVVRPSAIELVGATPTTFVTAEVSNRSIVYVIIDTMRMLARGEVPGLAVTDWNLFSMSFIDEETNEEVTIAWGGEWEMTLENFRDLGIAMMVALLLVYGVLVAQYNRFSTPAYILVTVPLGLVGILWGFFILDVTADIYLTATALIGFIALIGIVVNNAIIFLEYVEQELRLGQPFDEALLHAGQARLRPILLTSLTTILASLTIAGDPVWSGLAWAIVFGLSLSTILTLVIYPTLLMYYTGDNYKNNN